jgi:chromate reductase, NAD(P)H dehydrogenase (quinone)
LRKASYNTALLHVAVALMPLGMTLEVFDLSPLSMFNQDYKKSFPEAAVAISDKLAQAEGRLIRPAGLLSTLAA